MNYSITFEGSLKLNKKLDDYLYETLVEYSEEEHSLLTEPSVWCDWVPSEDRTEIVWNGSEDTRATKEWLEFLIQWFFKPRNYILNGRLEWSDNEGNKGYYEVINNKVEEGEL